MIVRRLGCIPTWLVRGLLAPRQYLRGPARRCCMSVVGPSAKWRHAPLEVRVVGRSGLNVRELNFHVFDPKQPPNPIPGLEQQIV
jgi:hypothetical protein